MDLRAAGLAGVWTTVKSLITNGPYVCNVLYETFDDILIDGTVSFGVKYAQQQFSQTASMAGIIFGPSLLTFKSRQDGRFFHWFLNSDIWESLSLDLVILNSHWFMLNVHSIVLLIVGKLLNLVLEVVILELVSAKFFSVLLYGLKCCQLNKADLQSLDFSSNRFFPAVTTLSDSAHLLYLL